MIAEIRRRAASGLRSLRVGRFVLALARELSEDDISGMSAEMAYRLIFALVPLLLLTVAVLGLVSPLIGLDTAVTELLAQGSAVLPSAIIEILDGILSRMIEDRSGTFVTVGILGTIWGAGSAVRTLIKGLNRAYDIDRPRPLWRRQLLGFVVSLVLPLFALASLMLDAAGRAVVSGIAGVLELGPLVPFALGAGRIAVVAIVFALAMSIVYYSLPNVRSPYKEALPGAILASAGLLILNAGFAAYVANASASAIAYTTFTAAFAFLLWLYLMSFAILVGAEINALLSPRGRSAWA